MGIAWTAITAAAFAALLVLSFVFFLYRKRGKSYFAVSTASIIGAVWASYAALLAINWPAVVVALVLRSHTDRVMEVIKPDWVTVAAALPVAMFVTFLLYRLASAEIRSQKLPLNASARELEEPGKVPGVFELAAAHARYRFAGRVDRPLLNPGDDPYQLPNLPRKVEWPSLSADLLVQLEPNLQRDTFRYIAEKQFYSLVESDVRTPNLAKLWLVLPTRECAPYTESLAAFDAFEGPAPDKAVLCVNSEDRLDEQIYSPRGSLVRVLSLGALLERTIDLHEYAASLIRRFEQRHVPGTNFTLKDSFVSLKATPVPPGDQMRPISTPPPDEDVLATLRQWSLTPGVDHLSIIGEFGQGKSTVLLAFCSEWARRWLDGERGGRIPLLIELRGKSPRRQSQDRFLAEWGDRYGLRGGVLLSLVQSGRATLIFEGFDEVQDAGLRFDRFEQFKALWGFSYPGAKLVFTGRPNFFLDTSERERLLRSSSVARDAGLENTRVLSLNFLSRQEISRALRAYPKRVRLEILAACDRDVAFKDIAKRPSMLPVIANQWSQVKAEVERGGVTSASIIRYFIDFLYARKEADTEGLGEYQLLHRSVRHYFTQRVAWTMASNNLRNTIDADTFVRCIEESYKDIDSEFRADESSDSAVASSVVKLREMFKSRPFAELIAYVASDVRTNGLLVPDPAGGRDNLYFPHKQYLEFVLAEVYVAAVRERSSSARWVARLPRNSLITGVLNEPVALFFASGLFSVDELEDPKVGLLDQFKAYLLVFPATVVLLSTWMMSPRSMAPRYKALRLIPLRFRGILYSRYNQSGSARFVATMFLVVAMFPFVLLSSQKLFILSNNSAPTNFDKVYGMPFFAMIIIATVAMWMVAGPFLLTLRGGPFTVSTSFLLMEAYRRGSIRRMESRSTREQSALICMIQWNLPIGAVNLPAAALDRAYTDLGLSKDTTDARGIEAKLQIADHAALPRSGESLDAPKTRH
jgi:hypothetical protein